MNYISIFILLKTLIFILVSLQKSLVQFYKKKLKWIIRIKHF